MSARVDVLLRELAAAIREDIGALPVGVSTLADELKLSRSSARMSLQEVADASGFTKSHVWEIEQGRSRNPTVAVIAGLSKALGVPFLRLAQAALNSNLERGLGGETMKSRRCAPRAAHSTSNPPRERSEQGETA